MTFPFHAMVNIIIFWFERRSLTKNRVALTFFYSKQWLNYTVIINNNKEKKVKKKEQSSKLLRARNMFMMEKVLFDQHY